MRPMRMVIALALAGLLTGAGEAGAQLFGNRTLGRTTAGRGLPSFGGLGAFGSRQSLGRQQSSGGGQSSASAASLMGFGSLSERHLRGGREASDFVGTDARDRRGFVGLQQAGGEGQIRSAIDDVRVQTGPDANRTQPPSPQRTTMYAPRLKVNFNFARRSRAGVSTELTRRLESSLTLGKSGSIEVSMEGATAILNGAVASERDRRLARLLLLLEPGISHVRDELVVRRRPPTPAPDRSARPTDRTEGSP